MLRQPCATLCSAMPLFVVMLLCNLASAQDATMNRVQRYLDQEDWNEAIDALETVTKRNPYHSRAFFLLGYALSKADRHEEAIRIAHRTTQFSDYRGPALFNLACSLSCLGRTQEAADALRDAADQGSLNYDLIATDEDLQPVLDEGLFALPDAHEYEAFLGRNRVEFAYHLQLPANDDSSEPSPALVVFPSGDGGPASADYFLADILEDFDESDWIVLTLIAPERSWFTHPSHHALEDLLKKVQKDHKIRGEDFHLLGFGEGCRAAINYSRMSRSFFQSMTLLSPPSTTSWGTADPRNYRHVSILHVAGSEHSPWQATAEKMNRAFSQRGFRSQMLTYEGEGATLEGVSGERLLQDLANCLIEG